MVKSMTGYGRARETRNGRDITVEVRSVNNRYLDCSVKMPRAYIFAEDAVKSAVQQSVSRGKVDVFITVESLGAEEREALIQQEREAIYLPHLGTLCVLPIETVLICIGPLDDCSLDAILPLQGWKALAV